MKRSEIWLINLDPTIGAEIRKIRPAIIISHDNLGVLPLKIVIPITEWKEQYSVATWIVQINPDRINGLTKNLQQIHCNYEAFQLSDLLKGWFNK